MTRTEQALGQGSPFLARVCLGRTPESMDPRSGQPKSNDNNSCLVVAGSVWAWGKRLAKIFV